MHNQADSLAYSAEKALKDAGDKVPENVRNDVEESIKNIREKIKSEDTDAIRSAIEDLNEKLQQIGASMYQQPEQEGAPGADFNGGAAPEAEDEDVVDGEFTE